MHYLCVVKLCSHINRLVNWKFKELPKRHIHPIAGLIVHGTNQAGKRANTYQINKKSNVIKMQNCQERFMHEVFNVLCQNNCQTLKNIKKTF